MGKECCCWVCFFQSGIVKKVCLSLFGHSRLKTFVIKAKNLFLTLFSRLWICWGSVSHPAANCGWCSKSLKVVFFWRIPLIVSRCCLCGLIPPEIPKPNNQTNLNKPPRTSGCSPFIKCECLLNVDKNIKTQYQDSAKQSIVLHQKKKKKKVKEKQS